MNVQLRAAASKPIFHSVEQFSADPRGPKAGKGGGGCDCDGGGGVKSGNQNSFPGNPLRAPPPPTPPRATRVISRLAPASPSLPHFLPSFPPRARAEVTEVVRGK